MLAYVQNAIIGSWQGERGDPAAASLERIEVNAVTIADAIALLALVVDAVALGVQIARMARK